MYEAFFGLKEPPFNLTPDPRFLFMSRGHREALESLEYAVQERKGFSVMTGEVGAGKTTLCRSLFRHLNLSQCHLALIVNSFMDDLELLQTVNREFDLKSDSNSRVELLEILNRFLLDAYEEKKNCLLIIDEAQNLPRKALEQIRMLSNLETDSEKLIQIILVGQPELQAMLEREELRQLNQRIQVRFHLDGISRADLPLYIEHRLSVAGCEEDIPFAPQALNRIYHSTQGIPRLINLLCDRALMAAYVDGQFEVTGSHVARAEKDLSDSSGIDRQGKIHPDRRNEKSRSGWWLPVLAVLMLGLLGGAFYLGLSLQTQKSPNGAAPPPSPPLKTEHAQATPQPLPPPLVERLSSGTLAQNWSWDESGLMRIKEPALAETAALLSLARLWGYEFETEPLRQMAFEEIQSLNLPLLFDQAGVPLRIMEAVPRWTVVDRLDSPVIVKWKANPPAGLSPACVLWGLAADTMLLGDPVLGMVRADRARLEPWAEETLLVFRDSRDWLETLREDPHRAGQMFRRYYTPESLTSDTLSLSDQLRHFQEQNDLEPSGVLDPYTAMGITREMETMRPRLQR